MATKRKKKYKLKGPAASFARVLCYVLCVLLLIFVIYRYEINPLIKLGYSEKASRNILLKFKKDDVLNAGDSKTLNAAFESEDYLEKNFNNYKKIDYQKQKNIISNINRLIKKGYTNVEISIILSHGTDSEVTEFSKREKVRYIEEYYSFDFAKLGLYDRYVAFSDETGENEENTVIFVNLNLDKEPFKDSVEVTDFDIDMLVNKYNRLDKKYVPPHLCKVDNKYVEDDEVKMNREGYNAFISMYNDAKKENINIYIKSGYRSYKDQEDIESTYLNLYGQSYVDKYVAKPGYSEHQTGLAIDIGGESSKIFANSKEYNWMLQNSYKYGFIFRFPKKYEYVTGYKNEAWHFRYVGKKAAKIIYDDDMTLEEYTVRISKKEN